MASRAEHLIRLATLVENMQNDERVLIDENKIEIINGFRSDGSNGQRLREVLKCAIFGVLPLTKSPLKGNWLWYDDDGMPEPPHIQGQQINELATALLGDQVCGGLLFGPVILSRPEIEKKRKRKLR